MDALAGTTNTLEETVGDWLLQDGWAAVVDVPDLAAEVQAGLPAGAPVTREAARRAYFSRVSRRLWLACAGREPQACNTAYQALAQYLRRVALTSTRDEDLAAEATQNALRAIHQSLAQVRDSSAFMGYCKMVVLREVIHLMRAGQMQQEKTIPLEELFPDTDDERDWADMLPDSSDLPDDIVADRLRAGALNRLWECVRACPQLGAQEKRLVMLMYHAEMTYTQLSARLSRSVESLHVALSRARSKMRRSREFVDCLRTIGLGE